MAFMIKRVFDKKEINISLTPEEIEEAYIYQMDLNIRKMCEKALSKRYCYDIAKDLIDDVFVLYQQYYTDANSWTTNIDEIIDLVVERKNRLKKCTTHYSLAAQMLISLIQQAVSTYGLAFIYLGVQTYDECGHWKAHLLHGTPYKHLELHDYVYGDLSFYELETICDITKISYDEEPEQTNQIAIF